MLSDRTAEAFVVTYFCLANSIKNRLLYILQLLLGDPNAIQSLVGDWQVFYDSFDVKISLSTIREYGSTLYVGMARKKNGRPYISIASDELKSLIIYTDKF